MKACSQNQLTMSFLFPPKSCVYWSSRAALLGWLYESRVSILHYIAACVFVVAFCGQVVVRGGRMCLFENTIYLERNDGE